MSASVCYYCGGAATTDEHVPPKQMFKKFDCDSITVPSCKEHNCSKGGQDQAIVTALLMPFKNKREIDSDNRSYFNKDILKALAAAKNSFNRTKNRVISKQLVNLESDKIKSLPELGFIKTPISIHNWIKNLTAGIVYDGIREFDPLINWNEVYCWSPDYLKGKLEERKSIDEVGKMLLSNYELKDWFNSFDWIKGWSAYPRKYPETIYCFYMCFNEEEIMLRHYFYSNYNWYAWFKPSKATVEKLKRKINEVKKF